MTTKIEVTDLDLTETRRHGSLPDRADVDFEGTITINGNKLPVNLHLFRVDKEGWQIGKWNASIRINEKPMSKYTPEPGASSSGKAILQPLYDFPEHCLYCHSESDTAVAVADVVHPWLHKRGFENIASGTGHRVKVDGKWTCTKTKWFIFDFFCSEQGPIKHGKSRRQFYHTESRVVVCPVHGKFRQKKEECSL
jgi:hypothetical protein